MDVDGRGGDQNSPFGERNPSRWNWLPDVVTPTSTGLRSLASAPKRWRQVTSPPASSLSSAQDTVSGQGQQEETPPDYPSGRCSHTITDIGDRTLLLLCGGSTSEEQVQQYRRQQKQDAMHHYNDLWMMTASYPRWTKVEPVLCPAPSELVRRASRRRAVIPGGEAYTGSPQGETSPPQPCRRGARESYWGMRFGPARRGHAAAYFHPNAASSDVPNSLTGSSHWNNNDALALKTTGVNSIGSGGRLIVFGGIATNSRYEPTRGFYNSNSASSSQNELRYLNDVWVMDTSTLRWRRIHPDASSCPGRRPPRGRRGAVYWIDGDYFHVFGGEIGDDSNSDDVCHGGEEAGDNLLNTYLLSSSPGVPPHRTTQEQYEAASAASAREQALMGGYASVRLAPESGGSRRPRSTKGRPRSGSHSSWGAYREGDEMYNDDQTLCNSCGEYADDNEDDEKEHDNGEQEEDEGHVVTGATIFRLGPLSEDDVTKWRWSTRRSHNSGFLHKRTADWPTVAMTTAPHTTVAGTAGGMIAGGGTGGCCSVSFGAHAVVGRKLWVFGGLDWAGRRPGRHPASNLLYRLDLDTFEWVTLVVPTSAPQPRYCHDMVSVGRFLLIGGGIVLGAPSPSANNNDNNNNDGRPHARHPRDRPRGPTGANSLTVSPQHQRATNRAETGAGGRPPLVIVAGGGGGGDGIANVTRAASTGANTSNRSLGTANSPMRGGLSRTSSSSSELSSNSDGTGGGREHDGPSNVVDANGEGGNDNHRHHRDQDDDAERLFFPGERTLFDLYLFDTESLRWKSLTPGDIPGPWPSDRNGHTLTRLGHRRVVLYGGGVYPTTYHADTHCLDFELPTEVPKPQILQRSDVCADLAELYRSGLMSDCVLVAWEDKGDDSSPVSTQIEEDMVIAGDSESRPIVTREFPVHKAILAARCGYFHTMFTGPYAESSQTRIELPEADPDALDLVLKYIYNGTIDLNVFNDDDNKKTSPEREGRRRRRSRRRSRRRGDALISSVLQLADLWQVTRLFETVEDHVATIMLARDVDVTQQIAYARAHNCRRLRMQGLERARREWSSLRHSSTLRRCDADIVVEIVDYMSSLL